MGIPLGARELRGSSMAWSQHRTQPLFISRVPTEKPFPLLYCDAHEANDTKETATNITAAVVASGRGWSQGGNREAPESQGLASFSRLLTPRLAPPQTGFGRPPGFVKKVAKIFAFSGLTCGRFCEKSNRKGNLRYIDPSNGEREAHDR